MKVEVILRSIWRGMQMAVRGPLALIMGTYYPATAVYDSRRSVDGMVSFRCAVVKIYKGTLVMVNAAGYLTPVFDTETGQGFAGVAAETIDNRYIVTGDSTSGAATAGDRVCSVFTSGTFWFGSASGNTAVQTDVGLPAYAELASTSSTDSTIKASTSGSHPVIVGKIVGVSSIAAGAKFQVDIGFSAKNGVLSA